MKKFSPKAILVPVDFSPYSLEALRAADGVAQLRKAEVTVLHVMGQPPPPREHGNASVVYSNWENQRNEIQKEADRELDAMLAEANMMARAKKVSVWGDPANEIVRMAKSGPFDLIAMSTHGRTGLSRLLMGSVAENVIRHAPCPVFVMRAQE